jgi:hypothetical protein
MARARNTNGGALPGATGQADPETAQAGEQGDGAGEAENEAAGHDDEGEKADNAKVLTNGAEEDGSDGSDDGVADAETVQAGSPSGYVVCDGRTVVTDTATLGPGSPIVPAEDEVEGLLKRGFIEKTGGDHG